MRSYLSIKPDLSFDNKPHTISTFNQTGSNNFHQSYLQKTSNSAIKQPVSGFFPVPYNKCNKVDYKGFKPDRSVEKLSFPGLGKPFAPLRTPQDSFGDHRNVKIPTSFSHRESVAETEPRQSNYPCRPELFDPNSNTYTRKISNESYMVGEKGPLGDMRRTVYAIVSSLNRNSGSGNNFFGSVRQSNVQIQIAQGIDAKFEQEHKTAGFIKSLDDGQNRSNHTQNILQTHQPYQHDTYARTQAFEPAPSDSLTQKVAIGERTNQELQNNFGIPSGYSRKSNIAQEISKSPQKNVRKFYDFKAYDPDALRLNKNLDERGLNTDFTRERVQRFVSRSPTPETQSFANRNIFYTDFSQEKTSRSPIISDKKKESETTPNNLRSSNNAPKMQLSGKQEASERLIRENGGFRAFRTSDLGPSYDPTIYQLHSLNGPEQLSSKGLELSSSPTFKYPKVNDNPAITDPKKVELNSSINKFQSSSFQNFNFAETNKSMNSFSSTQPIRSSKLSEQIHLKDESHDEPLLYRQLSPNIRANERPPILNRSRSPIFLNAQYDPVPKARPNPFNNSKDQLCTEELKTIQNRSSDFQNNCNQLLKKDSLLGPLTSGSQKDSFREKNGFVGRTMPRDSILLGNKSTELRRFSNPPSMEELISDLNRPLLVSTDNSHNAYYQSIEINSLASVAQLETPRRTIYSARSMNSSPKSSFSSKNPHSTKSILKKPGNKQINGTVFKKKKCVTFNEMRNSNYLVDRYDHVEDNIIKGPQYVEQAIDRHMPVPQLYRPTVTYRNGAESRLSGTVISNVAQIDQQSIIKRIRVEDRVIPYRI